MTRACSDLSFDRLPRIVEIREQRAHQPLVSIQLGRQLILAIMGTRIVECEKWAESEAELGVGRGAKRE
jgi:anthranilate/para-aminobenzoate synthase component II